VPTEKSSSFTSLPPRNFVFPILDSRYLKNNRRRLSSRCYRFATTWAPLIISDISQAIDFSVDRASFSEDIAGQSGSNKSGYGDSGFRVARYRRYRHSVSRYGNSWRKFSAPWNRGGNLAVRRRLRGEYSHANWLVIGRGSTDRPSSVASRIRLIYPPSTWLPGEIQGPWRSVTAARFRVGLIALCGKSSLHEPSARVADVCNERVSGYPVLWKRLLQKMDAANII